MHTQLILNYLTNLSEHNDREWYHAHKAENKAANTEFEALIKALILRIGEFDASVLHNEPKRLTFKLVRDTRFSHDKSPYNPAFRAHISSKGKLPVPVGYYLMIKPGNQSFLGGGLFADMFKEATAMVRDAVHSAALTCYAVEGCYPEDVDYLREHYGLRYDQTRYLIHYDAFASNIMPDIRVSVRGESGL